MTKPITGRRWNVVSTGYFGTPKASSATTAALRRKYTIEGGPTTAVGDRVSLGDIAVPSNIPLGSKFYIPGYGWGIAKDHGGAIKGNRIDLAFGGVDPTGTKHNPQAEMKANNWGKRTQTVYVFPSSFQIPADHSPPQAYKNDVSNKGKAPVGIKVASIFPSPNGGSTKTITSKKEGLALRDKILKDLKKGVYTPSASEIRSANENDKNWHKHMETYDWEDPVHGQKDPNKFLGWSELGSLAYKQKIDKVLNSDDSPEQKIGLVQQIKDGIKYQLFKKKMDYNDGASAYNYGVTKIDSLQNELMGGKTKIKPAAEPLDVKTTRSEKPQINPTPLENNVLPTASTTLASPRKSTPVVLQSNVSTQVREPSLGIRAPKMKGSIAQESNVSATTKPVKSSVTEPPKQAVQTSMPALSQKVRTSVTSTAPTAEIKSNANPQLKGPTGQVVIDRTKKPINVATPGIKSLAPAMDEPLPSIDKAAAATPKITSPEIQQKKPNSVLTNYVKRINTIDSLVDPSKYLQRKQLFLKEQAAIKDMNNDLSIGDRKRLLDTLGAYPEDNRKPQTLGGVVRAGNNAVKGESRK